MSRAVLAVVGAKARSLGLLAAAVLAGGIAMAALPSSAASGSADSHRAGHQSSPDAHGPAGDHGVHGQCVSKVARDPAAVGGPHHNHGGAVSAAAHSCPHG